MCPVSEANKGIVNPIKARLLFLRPLKIKFYIISSEKTQDQTRKEITEVERNEQWEWETEGPNYGILFIGRKKTNDG